MDWRGDLGGLPTSLVVLWAEIRLRTLLLLLTPQTWQVGSDILYLLVHDLPQLPMHAVNFSPL